jgi:hypothetical protein
VPYLNRMGGVQRRLVSGRVEEGVVWTYENGVDLLYNVLLPGWSRDQTIQKQTG